MSCRAHIHDGDHLERYSRAGTFRDEDRCQIWVIDRGAVCWSPDAGLPQTQHAPSIVLSQSASAGIMSWQAGCSLRRIGFTVDDAPCDLPAVVPTGLQERTARMVRHWSDRWWRGPVALARCEAQLTLLLLDLMGAKDEPVALHPDPWVTQVRDTIRDRLPHGVTAQAVAQMLGMSRAHCYRRLAANGQVLGDMIDDLRHEHAVALLGRPAVRIGGVARMCGFASSVAFARWFHKRFGCTPTAWRSDHIPGFTRGCVDGQPRRLFGQWDRRPRYP
jgi:AraC-like DNA-binding protein